MRSFLISAVVGAVTIAIVALLSGMAAEHLLAQWKSDQGGWLSGAFGFFFGATYQVLMLPARVLSLGSDSPWSAFLAFVVCFICWGLAVAVVWRRARSAR